MKIRNFSLAVVFTMGASAAVADDYSFKYSMSDLNTYQGVSQVHKEIQSTAKEHCPSYTKVRSLADVRACREDVANDLVEKIASAKLTAYHNGETSEQIALR